MSRKPRVGLTRLSVYVRDQRMRIALLSLAAAFTSAVQVGGWLLVGDAIDNGIRAHDTSRLDIDVAIYVGVNALAWLVGSFLIMGLAQLGQLIVLRLREHLFGHLTTLSLRYFSEQRAGWIISRITNDVDALSRRALGGPLDARRQCPHAHGRADRAGDPGLAAGARDDGDPAADA